jgi:hypothetical protein
MHNADNRIKKLPPAVQATIQIEGAVIQALLPLGLTRLRMEPLEMPAGCGNLAGKRGN